MKKICVALLLVALLLPHLCFAQEVQPTPPFELLPQLSEDEKQAMDLLEKAYQLDDEQEQLECAREAAKLAPENVDVLLSAAQVLYVLDFALEGADEYEPMIRKAISLAEGDRKTDALQQLAELLIRMDRASEAVLLVQEAVDASPKTDRLQMLLAMSLYYNEQNDDALTLLEALSEDSPQNVEALGLRAAIFLDDCRYTDAIDAYRQIVDNFPGYPFALQGLYKAYEMAGEFERAVRTIDDLLRHSTDDSLFVERAQIRLYRMYDPQLALKEAEALVRSSPESFDGYVLALSASAMLEDYQKAGDFADGVAMIDSDYGILLQATIAGYQKKWAEAERLGRSVIQRDPDNALAHMRLADTLLSGKGDTEGATKEIAESFALAGDAADTLQYMQLGRIYMQQQKLLEAARAFSYVAEQTFDDPSPLVTLLDLYRDAGREQDMLDTLEQIEKQYPGFYETMYARVMALDAIREPEGALEAYQAMKQKFPFPCAEMIGLEGILLASTGDATGVRLIREWIEGRGDEADANDYNDLAVALLLLGDLDACEEALDTGDALIDAEMLEAVLSERRTKSYLLANRAELCLARGELDACLDALEESVSYGFVPTTLGWIGDFSAIYQTERGQALLAAFPFPDEAWDVTVPPEIPKP